MAYIPKPEKQSRHLAAAVERNINALIELRRQMERKKGLQDRVADAITAFSGSMWFVYLHVLWFGVWVGWNMGWLGLPPFDPFPFGLLTMIVSLEAIFLSTFVLISQNRMGEAGDQRSDLDVQIDLLAEYEMTKMLRLTHAIAKHLGLPEAQDGELADLEKAVSPTKVLKEMEAKKRKLGFYQE